ncbi:hypothetical protein [Reyranella sp. CPCC 100927]|uniref:hypothetical protein n=1 Tax=Reyranella sp. CPCC 100927 TaxID=2599616 RepID=UPI0011B4AFD5|nr:hypothetical protein [Reyranella sp. CPCC 100927]TWS96328.1 hypothetical protein FQU96_39275 [Reyranella sp. CPCC 100927]
MIGRLKGLLVLALLCGTAIGALPAGAQSEPEVNARLDSLFGDHKPYRAFFIDLKAAVVAGNKPAVAAMIAYPLTIRSGGKDVALRAAPDLLARYDQIVTARVVAAVRKQTYETLFARDTGVMIGDGEVWFSGICNDNACQRQTVKVIAIAP